MTTQATQPAGSGSGQAGGTGEQQVQEQGQGLTFDAWIAEQPDEVKTLLDGHTSGLKNAMSSEREARKQLEKQLKDLAGKAENGSEFEKQLNEVIAKQAAVEQQADFYEQAHAKGVTNLKLAWIAVTNDGLVDAKGRVNFEDLKKNYPELFGAVTRAAPGNAGAGTNKSQQPGKSTMNDFIRKAAGRG